MRAAASLFLLVALCTGHAHAQSREHAYPLHISELQAAHPFEPRADAAPVADWIEVYNSSDAPFQLLGTRFAVDNKRHMIDAPLMVPANGFRVLWCDGRTDQGPDHLDLSLPRDGAIVRLIGSDGVQVLDSMVYSASPIGYSVGRIATSTSPVRLFSLPTPGFLNNSEGPASRALPPIVDTPSGRYSGPLTIDLVRSPGAVVHYTLNGAEPDDQAPRWTGPVRIQFTTTLRARSYAQGLAPSSELVALFTLGQDSSAALCLALAPEDLWDDSTGIYTEGLFENHTRRGRSWERKAIAHFLPRHGIAQSTELGIRLSGSGSRGLAKRSFKLYARDAYAGPGTGFTFRDGTHCNEGMLRADATPHAFLRNIWMEEVVRRSGAALAVQPSVPLPLLLNGAYWGLYRWMPPKDAEWLRGISAAHDVDVLEGPANTALSGSNADFLKAMTMLAEKAPMDSLALRLDVGSLIDLACLDLYTGRADHDLNVRCYRPHIDGVPRTWRWVLFDMDLWAPVEDNSLGRMCSTREPEAPYLPYIMAHPELRERFLRRMVAFLAETLAPERALPILDSLYRAHEVHLQNDHARWSSTLHHPEPQRSLEELKHFIRDRKNVLLHQLARYCDTGIVSLTLTVPPASQGEVRLEGLALSPGTYRVQTLKGLRLQVSALPAAGYEFAGWNGASDETEFILPVPIGNGTCVPHFRPAGLSGKNALQQRLEQ